MQHKEYPSYVHNAVRNEKQLISKAAKLVGLTEMAHDTAGDLVRAIRNHQATGIDKNTDIANMSLAELKLAAWQLREFLLASQEVLDGFDVLLSSNLE